MVGIRKPVSPATKAILTVAIAAGLSALALAAAVFDQQTQAGNATQRFFAALFGLALGPAPILAGIGALLLARRSRDRKLFPIAIAAIAFGAVMSWLFFVETADLPRLWP